MRRSILVTISALGLLISLVGSTGLFAALQDDATTGGNSANSAPLDASADLQIASATIGPTSVTCNAFDENLATGLFAITDLLPDRGAQSAVCLRNVGSQAVDVTTLTFELTDRDNACTGDEVDWGDTNCNAGQPGELSAVLRVSYTEVTCDTVTSAGSPRQINLNANQVTPIVLDSLAPDQTRCYVVDIGYPSAAASTQQIQQAQSDSVTWRFRYHAQVPA